MIRINKFAFLVTKHDLYFETLILLMLSLKCIGTEINDCTGCEADYGLIFTKLNISGKCEKCLDHYSSLGGYMALCF